MALQLPELPGGSLAGESRSLEVCPRRIYCSHFPVFAFHNAVFIMAWCSGCEPKSGNVDRNLWNHSSKWTLSTLGWFSQLSRHTDGKAINTSVRLWGDASVGTVKGLKTQIKLSFKSKGQMIQIASVRNETDPLDVDRIIWLRTGLYMFGNSKKAHQFQYKPARWTW